MRKIKILFVADGRSPTALNWIRYFVDQGMDTHLISTYPCKVSFNAESIQIIPILFSGAGLSITRAVEADRQNLKEYLRKVATPGIRTWIRHRFVPHGLYQSAETLTSTIEKLQPDIVHVMRIPFEGMMTTLAYNRLSKLRPPFLISIWGNDFTLHAPSTKKMGTLTRQTLKIADGLHADCRRDLSLAHQWGYKSDKPAIVLPGAGGIQLDLFFPPNIDPDPIVINPRGFRAYIRNDTFFKAIPLILEDHPGTKFICPTMEGQNEAEQWVEKLDIKHSVTLLPRQERSSMADLYRQSQIIVSPSTHDGTPNTLLEAMACGCIPVAGDLESIREWITPGVNGMLVDPHSHQLLAEAVSSSLKNKDLRDRARKINVKMIAEKANYREIMKKAEDFYRQLIGD